MSSHTSIRRVDLPPQHQVVALTFDLCEGAHEIAGYDALIVDYLRQQDIPATFFAGGRWMQHHEKRLMQLMADPLFEIGNHSWSHANLRVTRGPRLIEEIQRAQTQYEEIYDKLVTMAQQHGIEPKEIEKIPSLPLTFRFPYGACSAEALHAVAEAGLPAIQWDVVSGDPAKQQTVQGMTATVLHHAKSGSIVIFHANGRGYKTAAALPGIIAGLRVRQFTFVTVSQLLELGRRVGHISAVDDCYEWRPGDNRRYDRQPR